MADFDELLNNYRNLVAKVDFLSAQIISQFRDSIACAEGCDACCRHISIFPVEAVAIAVAIQNSPQIKLARIRNLAAAATADCCPLLENGRCILYEARPIICRTHGLPLLTFREGENTLDFCPLNFEGITSFPATAILNLDILNATLASINAVFIASAKDIDWIASERITMAEALLITL